MPWGVKEGFSYGGRLCSIVGWLGYGGNLTWRKQEYFVEHVLGARVDLLKSTEPLNHSVDANREVNVKRGLGRFKQGCCRGSHLSRELS